jgi:ABC-type amino acid transport substrate-binding protein
VQLQPDDGVRLVEGYTPEPDLRWNVALGFKDVDQALIDAVNAILARRMADGTVKSIFAKYGVPYYPPFDLAEHPKQAAATPR